MKGALAHGLVNDCTNNCRGLALHRPLVQVPENTLKFVVGLMLSSFGVFWTGEGLGADWPGDDLALLWIFVVVLVFSLSAVRLMARPKTEATI